MKQVVITTVELEAWEEEYLVTYYNWTSTDILQLKQGEANRYESAQEKFEEERARWFASGWNARGAYIDD